MENKTLKLITLNAWHGRSLYPLMRFFRKYKEMVDIFCLQEVGNGDQKIVDERHPDEHVHGQLFTKIAGELTQFDGSFAAFQDDPHRMSLAIFVRRGIPVKIVKSFVVYQSEKPQETGGHVLSPRQLQYTILNFSGREILIMNYHGLWTGGSKTDTPERIAASKEIRKFMDTFTGPKILCGDFNLLPETESVAILEKGMKNLVKENHIESTRTLLYRHYDDPNEPNFADYMLTSPEIKVERFEVLPDLVSDHAPLYLEFSCS